MIKSIIDGFKYHPLFFMLRNSLHSEDPVYPFAHQLELLGKLFGRRPIRALVGDEIGLGKTVSAIMLIRYLLEVDGIKRTLILVPRVLMQQWLAELKRFGLANVVQLERDTIARHQNQGFPQGVYLASIDLLKREEHKARILGFRWDLIVVDEAHRVGKMGSPETKRYAFVSQLVGKPDVNVIMLTATPHRGRAEDYIERLKLIDPFIKADARELDDERFYRLCMGSIIFRRTKLDVNEIYERRRVFTDCKFKARVVRASEEEEDFHRELVEFLRVKLLQYYGMIGEAPRALPLLMALIAKRASSSPRAAVMTLDRMIRRRAEQIKSLMGAELRKEERELDEEADLVADVLLGSSFEEVGLYEDERDEKIDVDELLDRFAERCGIFLKDEDVERLKRLHDLARRIISEKDSRLNSLVNVVLNHLKRGEKVVVFTEFRDTAVYIFEEVRRRLPKEFAEKTAMVTASEVKPPAGLSRHSKDKRHDVEDVKKWLRDGSVLLLISTDVASEGLNLQAANVVVHYEPTWSPVKIVQRIGRVWRLGQERDVISYSLLLTVESDMAALEVLYAKLLSWIVSGIERKVPIGEELEVDLLPKDKTACDLLQIPLTTEGGRPQYSEFKAWIEFITGGKDRLRRYVEGIIAALVKLKERAERMGLNRMERIKVEKLLTEGLGGLCGDEIEKLLIHLLKSTARLCGCEVEERGSGIFVKGTHMTGLRHPLEFYRGVEVLLRGAAEKAPVVLVAKVREGQDLRELYLYEVVVHLKGAPVFSETVGIAIKEDGGARVCRGACLLRMLLELVEGVFGVGDHFSGGGGLAGKAELALLEDYCNRIVSDYLKYLKEVEGTFSSQHLGWVPRGGNFIAQQISTSQRLLGVIIASTGKASQAQPPSVSEEVEKRAMEFAMEFERGNGRVPEDVSKAEHYDIRSVDPRTGEVRFIEVKGRWDLDTAVELTEAEYAFGKRMGDNYWLYIVYGFSASNPRLLAIRDPINKAKWSVMEVKRFKFLGV